MADDSSRNDRPLASLGDPHATLSPVELEEIPDILDDLKAMKTNWLWQQTTARLRRGVFHVTGVEGWGGVRRDGVVLPTHGDRPFMFPNRSPGCRGMKIGGVCLFDLETSCIEVIAHKWSTMLTILLKPGKPNLTPEQEEAEMIQFVDKGAEGTPRRPIVIVQFGDRAALPGPWEYWRKTCPCPTDCVPYLECWHRAPMPLEAVTAVHVLRQDAKQPDDRWRTYGLDESLTLDIG